MTWGSDGEDEVEDLGALGTEEPWMVDGDERSQPEDPQDGDGDEDPSDSVGLSSTEALVPNLGELGGPEAAVLTAVVEDLQKQAAT